MFNIESIAFFPIFSSDTHRGDVDEPFALDSIEYLRNSMMGIHTKFPDLCDAKNREKYTPKRNNHTQDSIYVVRQFAYIHEVAEISLFLGEKYRMQQYSFFSLKKKKHLKP